MSGRFPFPAFPNGWFRAAALDDLKPGTVRPLRVLGQDLVLVRPQQGPARVYDAHCPHLGTHLGHGGALVEGDLQCPFHGWRFAEDGACRHVPGGRVSAARLRVWPSVEWCGQLMLWHHAEGAPPAWELPRLDEWGAADWRFRGANAWTIRSHAQEFGENGMDIAHFPFLHSQQTETIRSESLEARGPILEHRTHQRYAIFGLARLAAREVVGPLTVTLVGPGIAINRASVEAGFRLSYVYLFFFTPLDGERVEMRSWLGMKRLGNPVAEWILMRKAIREGARTIEQDIPIWENKRYRERPLLSEVDGPILQFRRWYRQFYSAAPERGEP